LPGAVAPGGALKARVKADEAIEDVGQVEEGQKCWLNPSRQPGEFVKQLIRSEDETTY
jgi:hypothetical protein